MSISHIAEVSQEPSAKARKAFVADLQAGEWRSFRSWFLMIQRCYDRADGAWKNYGGRGISVCSRWHDFFSFLEDMGPRSEDLSLDRVDVNGGYGPENCRWADDRQQARNTRRNRKLTADGMLQTDAAKAAGVHDSTIMRRLQRGYSVEDAIGGNVKKFKLTRKDAENIRAISAKGISAKLLATYHGVSRQSIENIVRGRTWKS